MRPYLGCLFEKSPSAAANNAANTATDIGPKIRLDYNDVMVKMREKGYLAPMGNWHRDRGMIYGCDQMSRGKNPYEYGDYFRSVRWFTAPGHDTPGSGADIIKGKVSSSISHMYDQPRVWLEGYHSAGWGMTMENLTQTTCENYAAGCNLLCLHGLYYTTHGGFWEWAPPCYHWRMPYWRHMGVWFKYFERLSYILSQGHHLADVAIVYPAEQFAAGYDGNASTNIAFGVGEILYRKGIDFDFIDGQSIDNAITKNGFLTINNNLFADETEKPNSAESFRVLILPGIQALRWKTLEKIAEFHKNGGIVIALEKLPEASDRVGANDEKLDDLIRSIFGHAANESAPDNSRSSSGLGVLLVSKMIDPSKETVEKPDTFEPPKRSYSGGFEGRWVWPETATNTAFFKSVWPGPDGEIAVRVAADNHGDLFVNGKEIAKDFGYSAGWTGTIPLKKGDVIVVECRDDDSPGGATAGMFFGAIYDGKIVLSSEDFKCIAEKPAISQRSDADVTKMKKPGFKYVHPTHLGVNHPNPKGPATKSDFERLADSVEEIVSKNHPRDFRCESGGAWINHRRIGERDVYYVVKAQGGSWCFFRVNPSSSVQSWDAWSGNRERFAETDIERQKDGIRVRLRDTQDGSDDSNSSKNNSVELIVFEPNDETNKQLPIYRRYKNDKEQTITGLWESEFAPTLDNTFGDFQLPAPKKGESHLIGPEARRFRYNTESEPMQPLSDSSKNVIPEWAKPEYDDSKWRTITAGYSPVFVTYTIPDAASEEDRTKWESELVDGKTPKLQEIPYCMSWRYGIEGNPGDQEGYHGLKEIISDDFIRVDNASPKSPIYFVSNIVNTGRTAASTGTKMRASIKICDGKHDYKVESNKKSPQETCMKPTAIWVNGKPVDLNGNLENAVEIESGINRVLIKFESPGRSHVVFENARNAEQTANYSSIRTPLSMKWYDNARMMKYVCEPVKNDGSVRAEWIRFVAPPGLSKITFDCFSSLDNPRCLDVFVDGKRIESFASNPTFFHGILGIPKAAVVAIRVIPSGSFSEQRKEGTMISDIKLTCEKGEIELGDWSKMGVLETYSGGIWYKKSIHIDETEIKADRIMLDLGGVVASAEVRVNGKLAGVLTTSPWKVDISKLVKPGENRIEILVLSTLANHFQTIPSSYRGKPTAGLFGPVKLLFQKNREIVTKITEK
ncbi:MAG: glycosylhydrolase-like jelly roll fold domain-containing protein [Thermoguttaceae bacterium]